MQEVVVNVQVVWADFSQSAGLGSRGDVADACQILASDWTLRLDASGFCFSNQYLRISQDHSATL